MRKRVFLCFLTMLLAFAGPGWATVTINTANFPDANFRAYVLDELDTDGNGSLSDAEIEAAEEIDVSGKSITDLKGIQLLTGTKKLYCDNNAISTLDVRSLGKLELLYCQNNLLTSLNISGCTRLKGVYCYNNLLTSLDAGECTALQVLTCYDNRITDLDVADCTPLRILRCQNNRLTELDVTKNTNLDTLLCYSNRLTALNLSGAHPKLKTTSLAQTISGMTAATATGNAEYPYQIDLNNAGVELNDLNGILTVKGYAGSSGIETDYNKTTGIARFKDNPTSLKYTYDTGFTGETDIVMAITLTGQPVIDTTELPEGYVGKSYNYYLTGTGSSNVKWSWSGAPAELALTDTTGKISGTPTTAETYNVTITATSGTQSTTKTLPLVIKTESEVPTRPTITTTTADMPIATRGIPYTKTLEATGTDPIKWSLSSGELPHNLTLSENGVISGTPDTVGKSTFTVMASNDLGERTRRLVINVVLPSTIISPDITTENVDLPSGTVNVAYSATLKATGTEPITWDLYSGMLPEGLTLSPTGIISGTPKTAGASNFTVKATNEAGSRRKTLRIAIYKPDESIPDNGNNNDNNDRNKNGGSSGGGGGCDAGFGALGLMAAAVFYKKLICRA